MHRRLPRWLIEAPYLYSTSIVCVLYALLRIATVVRHAPIERGGVEAVYPMPLVWTWVAMLGIGGVLVLLSRPWYALRTEAVGLTLLVGGMLMLTIGSAVQGPAHLLGAALLAALTFGTFVQLRITMKALAARKFVREHEQQGSDA